MVEGGEGHQEGVEGGAEPGDGGHGLALFLREYFLDL